ncbi:glycosyl hydrolase, partial [Leifsonia sp. SIMBA_070]|uniref:glycosyl hydrolase n=1 Tax=Leifsonia sp. SIMBA_070 TaxID=3085810 RepID=UPI00397BA268
TDHIRRAQYLLQQGTAVVDICYFKGDDPASGIPDIYLSGIVPEGYKGDVIGRDVLLNQISIKNQNIELSQGMQYKICVLADVKALLPE